MNNSIPVTETTPRGKSWENPHWPTIETKSVVLWSKNQLKMVSISEGLPNAAELRYKARYGRGMFEIPLSARRNSQNHDGGRGELKLWILVLS